MTSRLIRITYKKINQQLIEWRMAKSNYCELQNTLYKGFGASIYKSLEWLKQDVSFHALGLLDCLPSATELLQSPLLVSGTVCLNYMSSPYLRLTWLSSGLVWRPILSPSHVPPLVGTVPAQWVRSVDLDTIACVSCLLTYFITHCSNESSNAERYLIMLKHIVDILPFNAHGIQCVFITNLVTIYYLHLNRTNLVHNVRWKWR